MNHVWFPTTQLKAPPGKKAIPMPPRSFSSIPRIDVTALMRASGACDKREVAEAIAKACEEVGFFYVENHGVPDNLLDDMFREAERFFCLPEEEKMKLYIGRDSSHYRGGYVPLGGETTQERKDWHEALDFQPSVDVTGATGSPFDDPALDELPWLRVTFSNAWDHLQRLAYRLAGALALGIGLDEDFFATMIHDPLGVLRLLQYPALPEMVPDGVGKGIGEHTDYGMLTILAQDSVGGLEVRNAAGQWIPADHRDRTLLVNIGKVIERLTNDRYRATWHRVRIPKSNTRHSIGFFFEPGYNTVIEPLPVCCNVDQPARYERCRFGEIMAQRYEVSFSSYRKAPAADEESS
jgi:isopenicillin N synthase-like dioxygenase